MTFSQPIWMATGSHSAEAARRSPNYRPGVILETPGASPLQVVADSPASMDVKVYGGSAYIEGTESSNQGVYWCDSTSTATVSLDTADATYDRIDLIVFRVRDSAYSGSDDDCLIDAVTGTPSASPSAPTVPDNALVLGEVLVGAGVSSISSGAITDTRRTVDYNAGGFVAQPGMAVPIATDADLPTLEHAGRLFYVEDTGEVRVRNTVSAYEWLGASRGSSVAIVRLSAAQSVAASSGGTTGVNFNTSENMPSGWSLTSGEVVVAEAGLYLAVAAVGWESHAGGGDIQTKIDFGSGSFTGWDISQTDYKNASSYKHKHNLTAIGYLNAGGTIGVNVRQNTGASRNVEGGSTNAPTSLMVVRLA